MSEAAENRIIFRCPPELDGILPPPTPAVRGLPDWFNALPPQAFSPIKGDEILTMKKCPPIIDATTYGHLMPLACDLTVENGEFGGGATSRRSPTEDQYRYRCPRGPGVLENTFIRRR